MIRAALPPCRALHTRLRGATGQPHLPCGTYLAAAAPRPLRLLWLACRAGIKQRLLAHLYRCCLKAHPGEPRKQQREALLLYRSFDMYRALIIRKVC